MKKVLSLAMAFLMLFSLCIVPAVTAAADGSAENPYYVANPNVAPGFITIPANGAVYYQYKAAVFGGWSVTGYGLTSIIVDGVVFDELNPWGEIEAPFNFKFMSPGIVAYVNDTAEEVQVMITHNEPLGTENNPDELIEGVNSLSIPANNPSYVADYIPTANGEYTFECAQTEDFIISIDIDGTSYTLSGSLTLELESYIPVRFYISPIGVTGEVDITVIAPKAGTEQNPIWLSVDEMEQSYVLEGTEPLYFNVDGSLSGNQLLIESKNGTALNIELDGTAYTADTGALYLDLDTNDWVISLVISQDADAANELYFSMQYALGTENNPIVLETGDNTIAIPENEVYYYSYTTETDGLLVLTPADASGFGLLDAAYEDAQMNYNYAYMAEGATSLLMVVPAGQTIIISACGVMDEETWVNGPVDTVLNVEIKDLLLYNTFEGVDLNGDLEGWQTSSELVLEELGEESNVASGFYSAEFNVTKDWGNIYRYVNVEANTDYEITFKAMGNKAGGLWAKFHKADWSGDVAQGDNQLTTEWGEYTTVLNSGDNTTLVLMFQYAGYAADGQIIWLDDIVISKVEGDEPVEPPVEDDDNLIVNGSFEDGSNGWEIWQDTEICSEAAKHGSRGAHLLGNGGWGGLLNQTVTVQAGKLYRLSFFIHVATVGVNVQVKDGSGNAIQGAGGWFDTSVQNHTVEWFFTATDDKVLINFCGSGTGNPEDVHVDDFVLEEIVVVEPSFDGYITNGDFETGLVTPWDNLWGSCPSVEIVEGGIDGGYALSVVSKQWNHVRQAGIAVEANTDYKITVWAKNTNNMCLLVKDGGDTTDIANVGVNAGDEWTQFVVEFNSGDFTSIIFSLMGGEGANQYGMFDNILMEKVEPAEILMGDVDGNGKVNNRDLGMMQLYLNDGDLTDKVFDEKAADLDGNGKINNRDLGLLQKKLNN
ncbi:MAG: carbohydrate binding domain-containing protein [Clostridia bacterium]|nr:carbohydrate binding domain-containing protein [Clostridia bacterium]